MNQQQQNQSILDKMAALAASYVPEWQFTRTDPDPGSVAAMLVADMLGESAARFDNVMRKHRVQYLNLFDRFKEEPIECAKSYVQFQVVPGTPGPAYVPKGTKALANASGKQITFETAFGITATAARLEAAYSVDGKKDQIVRQFVADKDTGAESCSFTAFDTNGENLALHMLLLGYRGVFDGMESLDLRLEILPPREEDREALFDALEAPGIRFALVTGLDEQGDYLLRDFQVQREGTALRLGMEGAEPRPIPLEGGEYYLLALCADAPMPLEIAGVRLWFADEGLEAREVVCRGIPQNTRHFQPFGTPLEIYATCAMESEVLSRRGARAVMRFDLAYETVEQLLPEYEVDTEYKVIMKKPPSRSRPKITQVHCDYVLLEYLGEGGWKRLSGSEEEAALFAGKRKGAIELAFTVPEDILPPDAAGEPRLRLRLVRADNLYTMPCRQLCPVVDNLSFSYSYRETPLKAEKLLTLNNFATTDVGRDLEQERAVRLFVSGEHPGTVQYLGFSGKPEGTPLSVYLNIDGGADLPVDFTAEYSAPGGFAPLKVVDLTGGMIYAEAMLLMVPRDAAPCRLFGRELTWIRLISPGMNRSPESLPHVEGIHLNMARVENVNTQTEYFHLETTEGVTRLTLGEQGLIDARVFVNEAGGEGEGENWVQWEKAARRDAQGRFYHIDLATGEVSFEKGVFSRFPVRGDGPAVKVIFQSYLGSAANVPKGSIDTLAVSIRHVGGITNPLPAYGGYDGYNEETGAAIISNMLRTRGRAVSRQDYFDIISQTCYSVKRIKVLSGVDRNGDPLPDAITMALLIDEYQQGGHIFSAVRERVREKLLSSSNLLPMGKDLILCQPHFVRISVRLWIECRQMEEAYDLQTRCGENIRLFLDPLVGGFDGTGWEIGTLPTKSQMLAYLKIRHEDAVVARMVMTAQVQGREIEVGDTLGQQVKSPFAMAVNGEHVVYVELARQE